MKNGVSSNSVLLSTFCDTGTALAGEERGNYYISVASPCTLTLLFAFGS